jgi:hypothetical protein
MVAAHLFKLCIQLWTASHAPLCKALAQHAKLLRSEAVPLPDEAAQAFLRQLLCLRLQLLSSSSCCRSLDP